MAENVSNIFAAAGDVYPNYSTISNWLADRGGDITAGNAEVGECAAESFNETVVINGFTTDADSYVELRSAAGAEHDGRANEVSGLTQAIIDRDAAADVVGIYDNHVRVSWMEIKGPYNNNNRGIEINFVDAGNDVKVHHNIIHNNEANNGTNNDGMIIIDADTIARIYRNIIYGYGSNGIGIDACAANTAAYYNTCYENNLASSAFRGGIRGQDADNVVKNNACFTNDDNDVLKDAGTYDNNATSDATGDGGAGLTNLVVANQFTDPTTTWADTDLTIKAGADLIDAGPDPVGTPWTDFPELNYPITDRDTAITGTFDVGADELVSAAPKMPIFDYHYRQKRG